LPDEFPQTKHPKLIVFVAFDRGEDGELQAVLGPAAHHTSSG
jgi:hypothetical protein